MAIYKKLELRIAANLQLCIFNPKRSQHFTSPLTCEDYGMLTTPFPDERLSSVFFKIRPAFYSDHFDTFYDQIDYEDATDDGEY